jgi:hypothetical protein
MRIARGAGRIAIGRIALSLAVAASVAGAPALAADTGNGSKNFRAPTTVPNYFSNEAGPLLGGAAETRRGELYTGAAPPNLSGGYQAPAPGGRRHILIAHGRGHLAARRGRPVKGRHFVERTRGHPHVAARHGATPSRRAATSKTTHVGSTRHRGRG